MSFVVRELDHLKKQETDIVEKVFQASGRNSRPELITEPLQTEISKVLHTSLEVFRHKNLVPSTLSQIRSFVIVYNLVRFDVERLYVST